ARSYTPFWTPLLVCSPVQAAVGAVARFTGRASLGGAVGFLAVLHELCGGGEGCKQADPMTYLGRVGPGHRARCLVGKEDPLGRPRDAAACAGRFPDGKCYVVPGLGHGGGDFVGHARTFLGTQLGDWRW